MKMIRLMVVMMAMAVLAGCGAVDSLNYHSSERTVTTNDPPPAAVVEVTGTADNGTPMANAAITVYGLNGTNTSVTDTNGNYRVNIANMTGPFVVKAVSGSGAGATTYYSFARAGGTANVNGLTNLIVSAATGNNDPASYLAAMDASKVTAVAGRIDASWNLLYTKLGSLFGTHISGIFNPMTARYGDLPGLAALFDNYVFTVSGNMVTITSATTHAVLASAPLAALDTLAVNNPPAPGSVGNIRVTAVSATSGEVGTRITVSGFGYDASNPLNNEVTIGGVRLVNLGGDTNSSINVVVPPGCPSGVIAVNNLEDGTSVTTATTFTVTKQYDYLIATATVASGAVRLTSTPVVGARYSFATSYEAGSVVEFKQNSITFTLPQTVATATIQMVPPVGLDLSQPFTVTVVKGAKMSNTVTVTP